MIPVILDILVEYKAFDKIRVGFILKRFQSDIS